MSHIANVYSNKRVRARSQWTVSFDFVYEIVISDKSSLKEEALTLSSAKGRQGASHISRILS